MTAFPRRGSKPATRYGLRTVEDVLGNYETLVRLVQEGHIWAKEAEELKARILDEGFVNLDSVLRGFGWIEEVSSGDKEKAWKTLANLGAVDWLEGMLTPVYDRGLSESQARKVWLAIAAMSAYALSTADSVRMRQEVVSGGNGMYAMVSVKKYLMTAVKIYQHQIGSRLRPVAPAYGSTFSFGRIRSEPPQMTADEIAPMVLSVEEISGLRAQGYSMLDEDAWNRLTTLLRTIRLNEGRIDDVAGLRQRILGATPEELASKALDDLVMESIHMRPVA